MAGGNMELYCAVALRGALPTNQLQGSRRVCPASSHRMPVRGVRGHDFQGRAPPVRPTRRRREVPTCFCIEVALRVRRGRMAAAVSGAKSPVTRAQHCA